jgi:hypothetical protein
MVLYLHRRLDWPSFRWREDALAATLAELHHRRGRFTGRMEALGFQNQSEAVVQVFTEDVSNQLPLKVKR